jgi:hypothetical protein
VGEDFASILHGIIIISFRGRRVYRHDSIHRLNICPMTFPTALSERIVNCKGLHLTEPFSVLVVDAVERRQQTAHVTLGRLIEREILIEILGHFLCRGGNELALMKGDSVLNRVNVIHNQGNRVWLLKKKYLKLCGERF